MQICKDHWAMMRQAIDDKGMSSLIAKDDATAHENETLQVLAAMMGDPQPHKAAPFDPLMSMNWHWANSALECGGLAVMTPKEDGTVRCPACEFVANIPGFVVKDEIENVAKQMQAYCYDEGLIPRPS